MSGSISGIKNVHQRAIKNLKKQIRVGMNIKNLSMNYKMILQGKEGVSIDKEALKVSNSGNNMLDRMLKIVDNMNFEVKDVLDRMDRTLIRILKAIPQEKGVRVNVSSVCICNHSGKGKNPKDKEKKDPKKKPSHKVNYKEIITNIKNFFSSVKKFKETLKSGGDKSKESEGGSSSKGGKELKVEKLLNIKKQLKKITKKRYKIRIKLMSRKISKMLIAFKGSIKALTGKVHRISVKVSRKIKDIFKGKGEKIKSRSVKIRRKIHYYVNTEKIKKVKNFLKNQFKKVHRIRIKYSGLKKSKSISFLSSKLKSMASGVHKVRVKYFGTKLEKVKKSLEKVSQKVRHIKMKYSGKNVLRGIKRTSSKVKELTSASYKISVDYTKGKIHKAAETMTSKMQKITGTTHKVSMEVKKKIKSSFIFDSKKLQRTKKSLRSISQKAHNIKVKASNSKALRSIKGIGTRLKKFTGKAHRIRLQIQENVTRKVRGVKNTMRVGRGAGASGGGMGLASKLGAFKGVASGAMGVVTAAYSAASSIVKGTVAMVKNQHAKGNPNAKKAYDSIVKIEKVFGKVKQHFIDLLLPIVTGILEPIANWFGKSEGKLKSLVGKFTSILEIIFKPFVENQDVFGGMFDGLLDTLGIVFDAIKPIIGAFAKINGLIMKLVGKHIMRVFKLLGKLFTLFKPIFSLIGFILGGIGAVLEYVFGFIDSIAEKIAGFIGGIFDFFKGIFGKVGGWIKDKLSSIPFIGKLFKGKDEKKKGKKEKNTVLETSIERDRAVRKSSKESWNNVTRTRTPEPPTYRKENPIMKDENYREYSREYREENSMYRIHNSRETLSRESQRSPVIRIDKIADSFVIKETADVDEVVDQLAYKLGNVSYNMS